jgi:hypothetical protein
MGYDLPFMGYDLPLCEGPGWESRFRIISKPSGMLAAPVSLCRAIIGCHREYEGPTCTHRSARGRRVPDLRSVRPRRLHSFAAGGLLKKNAAIIMHGLIALLIPGIKAPGRHQQSGCCRSRRHRLRPPEKGWPQSVPRSRRSARGVFLPQRRVHIPGQIRPRG